MGIRAANAPAPSPPGFPCKYVVPFDFKRDVDAHTQLPDGDTIILTRTPAGDNHTNNTIQVRLKNDADNWWKSITQHRNNKYLREVVATQGSRKEDSGEIQV